MRKLFLSALLAASFGAHTNNLVVDGSFEDQSQAANSWSVYNSINGWTTVGGSGIEVRNAVAGTAFDGSNFVELDSYNNSAMAQTLGGTTAGARYDVSFEYSGRAGVPATSNPIEVLWNGASIGTVTADGTAFSDNVWNLYSYNVTGTGNDVLSFRAIGTDDSVGGSLDAVAVTPAVPEPSTWVLAVAGFAMMGMSIRKRRLSN